MGVPDAAISMVLVPDLARAKSLTAKLLSFSVLNIKSNFAPTKYLLIRFTCNSLGWTNIAVNLVVEDKISNASLIIGICLDISDFLLPGVIAIIFWLSGMLKSCLKSLDLS